MMDLYKRVVIQGTPGKVRNHLATLTKQER
jgi:hypothetical protein